MSDFRCSSSFAGIPCQLNCKFQSNPPTFVDLALPYMYSIDWSLITSITGVTTLDLFAAIRSSKGSSQPKKIFNKVTSNHAKQLNLQNTLSKKCE